MSPVTGVSAVDEPPGPGGRDALSATRRHRAARRPDLRRRWRRAPASLVIAIVAADRRSSCSSQAIPALRDNEANFLTSPGVGRRRRHARASASCDLLWATVLVVAHRAADRRAGGVGVALFLTALRARAGCAGPPATWSTCWPPCRRSSTACGACSIFRAVHQAGRRTFLQRQPRLDPALRRRPASRGGTIFFAGIVLAIMILPIITALSREVFAQTPADAQGGRAGPRRHPLGDDPHRGAAVRPARRDQRRDARPRPRARRDDRRADHPVHAGTRRRLDLVAVQRRRHLRLARSPTTRRSSTPRRRPAPTSRPAWCCSSSPSSSTRSPASSSSAGRPSPNDAPPTPGPTRRSRRPSRPARVSPSRGRAHHATRSPRVVMWAAFVARAWSRWSGSSGP